ncbi:MAG TPA: glycosyltransferase family 2 protein [Anaerolineales bacterium]|nr:glycosyltransferase family 2 protein [Anaerolineales bacterium]
MYFQEKPMRKFIPAEPLVSVVMPMFNAERFLEAAIQSILTQYYRNFELIIVDDGSRDRSWDIASKHGQHDERIRLIRLPQNQRVAAACNVGIQVAQGKYIARMDADDVSLPGRFSTQVEFMESHPDIGVLGCGMRFIDEAGNPLGIPPIFQGDLSIRWHLLYESPLFHATVMLRKSVMDRFDVKYDPLAIYGEEDYELWTRFLLFTEGENLSEVLYHYRLYPGSVSQLNNIRQHESLVNISTKAVLTHLPEVPVSFQEIKDLQIALKGISSSEKTQRAKLIPVYFKIWDEFRRLHQKETGIFGLEQSVLAWAARMILYPLFQPNAWRALLSLTKRSWKWPFYLLKRIPYYLARRRIG